jgi:beta-lactamase superfamily II metal-dependent hydrolase
MENWSYYDQEGMLEDKCYILRTAHHGSCNGTQWERINRLKPMYTIVSANPLKSHHLPDLVGTAIFAKYSLQESYWKKGANNVVALTSETGTIKITIPADGERSVEFFKDTEDNNVDLANAQTLTWESNPTEWDKLLHKKAEEFYQPE